MLDWLERGWVGAFSRLLCYQQDDADFDGIEFPDIFDLAEGGFALQVVCDSISAEFDNAGDVPRLPPHRIGAKLAWIGSALGANARVADAGNQADSGDWRQQPGAITHWDAGIDYRATLTSDFELLALLKCTNISDKAIRLNTSFLGYYLP